jgi:ABC-type multidrug transport system ATPase subunit
VEQLCSDVAILARGRLVACGRMAALVGERTLEDVFFEVVTP